MRDQVLLKNRRLVESLYSKTIQFELSWIKATGGKGFECSIGSYLVSIYAQEGEFATNDIYLKVRTQNWEDVDEFSDLDISADGARPTLGGFSNHSDLMEELFNIARRQARGADKAIDDLLEMLS